MFVADKTSRWEYNCDSKMKLSIRNMVCPRCVMVVRELLRDMGYEVIDVRLGYAIVDGEEMSEAESRTLNDKLRAVGFELIADGEEQIVERVKLAVIDLARMEGGLSVKLSKQLEGALGQSYKSLTSMFSKIEGRTIESYYIRQRIEYVKELISYGDLSLSEIAYKTGYSSVAYLSKQFAQIVGMTVTDYKKHLEGMREPLTSV